MDKKYYSLYHNESKSELKIKKLKEGEYFIKYIDKYGVDQSPIYYNDNYFLGVDRKALKELAIKIKNEWIADLQKKIEEVSAIKV